MPVGYSICTVRSETVHLEGANHEMHPAQELADYLASTDKPDFAVIDRLWAAIEEAHENESDASAAA